MTSTKPLLTEKQEKMMRHALGLDWKDKPYRNRYQTVPKDNDWENLRNKGFAVYMGGSQYAVTTAGAKALGIDPELLRDC